MVKILDTYSTPSKRVTYLKDTYLQFIAAKYSFDRGWPSGCTEELLEQAVLVTFRGGRTSHDLPQVLLLTEENPSSFQEPKTNLLLA